MMNHATTAHKPSNAFWALSPVDGIEILSALDDYLNAQEAFRAISDPNTSNWRKFKNEADQAKAKFEATLNWYVNERINARLQVSDAVSVGQHAHLSPLPPAWLFTEQDRIDAAWF